MLGLLLFGAVVQLSSSIVDTAGFYSIVLLFSGVASGVVAKASNYGLLTG